MKCQHSLRNRFFAYPGRRALQGGFTLYELVAVVAIMSISTAMIVTRMGPGTIGNLASRSTARQLTLHLMQARRMAIATSKNHYLSFTKKGTNLTGYSVYRVDSPKDVLVEPIRTFDKTITVTGPTKAEFEPMGTALSGYTFSLKSSDKNYQVQVVAASGAVKAVEL